MGRTPARGRSGKKATRQQGQAELGGVFQRDPGNEARGSGSKPVGP
jgi:hypothetical protein